MISSGFGDWRSLLERQPSEMLFGAIAQRLDKTNEQDEDYTREVLLPYIKSKLANWPENTRLCPRHRLREYESGLPVWCELVRALDYNSMILEEDSITRLLAVDGVEHITHLNFEAADISWTQLVRLATSAPFRLKSFAMSRNAKIDWDALDTLFSSSMFSTVARLSFRGWAKIRVDVYTRLAEHFPLENLRALDVSGGAMSARKLGELVGTGRLDQLEEFYAQTWTTEAFKPGMIGVFAQHSNMQNLRVIDVAACNAKELKALANAEHLSSLRVLRFGTASDLSHLNEVLNAPHLNMLEELSLFAFDSQSHGYVSVMDACAKSNILEHLHTLKFSAVRNAYVEANTDGSFCEQPHFVAALEAGGFDRITRFCIELNPWVMNTITDHEVVFPQLKQLMLFGRNLPEQAMREAAHRLFTRQCFPMLDTLVVNMIDPAPVFDVLKQNHIVIKNLKVVAYGQDALAQLIDSAFLANIEVLDLSDLSLSYNAELLEMLFASPCLKQLRTLVVNGWSNLERVKQLSATHPALEANSVYACTVEDAHLKRFDWLEP